MVPSTLPLRPTPAPSRICEPALHFLIELDAEILFFAAELDLTFGLFPIAEDRVGQGVLHGLGGGLQFVLPIVKQRLGGGSSQLLRVQLAFAIVGIILLIGGLRFVILRSIRRFRQLFFRRREDRLCLAQCNGRASFR